MTISILGVGFNSDGKYDTHVNGIKTRSFSAWLGMLMRCYSSPYQKRYPTYIGCEVSNEWHDYQAFAEWYESHDFYGKDYQLDKDLLVRGNKIYGPDTCCLVPRELNSLLLDRGANRGDYPQGVHLYKRDGKFVAKLRINGKRKHLGHYACPYEAHKAYVLAKESYVKAKALEWRNKVDNRVFDSLMSWTVSS